MGEEPRRTDSARTGNEARLQKALTATTGASTTRSHTRKTRRIYVGSASVAAAHVGLTVERDRSGTLADSQRVGNGCGP